jgi:hypothetical protein
MLPIGDGSPVSIGGNGIRERHRPGAGESPDPSGVRWQGAGARSRSTRSRQRPWGTGRSDVCRPQEPSPRGPAFLASDRRSICGQILGGDGGGGRARAWAGASAVVTKRGRARRAARRRARVDRRRWRAGAGVGRAQAADSPPAADPPAATPTLRVLGDVSLFFGRDYTAPSRSKRVSRGVTKTGHLALRNRALVTLPRRTAPSGP